MTTTTPQPDYLPDLTELDHAALQLALDLTLADDPSDPDRVEQVTDFLQGGSGIYEPPRPWLEVAMFCAYHQQVTRLNLHPGASPPCWIITREEADAILADGPILACDGSGRDISNCSPAMLLKRMLRAGISPYHPNPLAAILKCKATKRRT